MTRQDKYCDDPKNIPAREMVGKVCIACHEAQMDEDEFNRQNELDLR